MTAQPQVHSSQQPQAQQPKVIHETINFIPFDLQLDFLRSNARYKAAVAGARGGKTKIGLIQCLVNAITQPGYDPSDYARKEPYTIVVAAHDYPQIKRIILPEFARMVPPSLFVTPDHAYNQTDHLMKIKGVNYRPGGYGETWIYFLSGMKPESWQGQKLYGVWIDEAALVPEELFNEMLVRITDRRGWWILTTTPRGQNWLYHRIYDPWKKGLRKDIHFATWKTAQNPHISREELEQKKRELPERVFRRNYEASFELFEGQIWEEWSEAIHVQAAKSYTMVLPNRMTVGNGLQKKYFETVIAGVDWGFAPGHAGAIVVCGRTKDKTWHVLDVSADEGIVVVGQSTMQDSWIRRAGNLKAKWSIERFYCDTESPQSIAQFKQAGLPALPALKPVREGCECVAKYMHVDRERETSKFIVLDQPGHRGLRRLCDEISLYSWDKDKEKPLKQYDDCCDALRYAIYTHEQHGGFTRDFSRGIVPGFANKV